MASDDDDPRPVELDPDTCPPSTDTLFDLDDHRITPPTRPTPTPAERARGLARIRQIRDARNRL